MRSVWLSHLIENDTPLYGGSKALKIQPDKNIQAGDSCNTTVLEFSSHTGTHLDVPYHFLGDGKKLDAYQPEDFIFYHPFVIEMQAKPGQLIDADQINTKIPSNTDLILVKTGFEQHRKTQLYWKESPGLAPELSEFFLKQCSGLKAVGMDFISISSLKHRDVGRKAHKAFLGKNILLIEDMKLEQLNSREKLTRVSLQPLRILNGDGAPCSIVGYLEVLDNL